MRARAESMLGFARRSVVWQLRDPGRREAVVTATPRWPRGWKGRRGLEIEVAESGLTRRQTAPFALWYADRLRALGWSARAVLPRK